MIKYLAIPLIFLASWSVAHANDKGEQADLRQAVECFPAKKLIKFFSKFDKMDADQRDSVDAFINPGFEVESGDMPDRMFYRHKEAEVDFTILPDGSVPDFNGIKDKHKDGELCVEDQARAGMSREEDGVSFGVDLDVRFINVSGVHTMDELKDGAKDGKSFYKKIVPAPVKLLIPKMTHVSVEYENNDTPADIKLQNGDEAIEGLIVESFGQVFLIELEQMESLGADRLIIGGGPYTLSPSPSAKKLEKFGFTEKSDDETAKDQE